MFENSVQWNKTSEVHSSTYSDRVTDAEISKTLVEASEIMKSISKSANIVRSADHEICRETIYFNLKTP